MTVMRKRTVLLGLLALLLALALQSWPGNSHPSVAHAAGTYTSTGVSPTGLPWLGYGLNEYPVMRDSSDANAAWTTANLNLTTSRLSYIKPGLTRINFSLDWFDPSGTVGDYDWTSSIELQDTWQILDYYKAQGYPLQVGIWDNVSFYDTTGFATLQADLVNELLNVKGYTNIKYYAATNEPNAANISQTQWATMISNLYAAFQSRGLPTSLLVGPDTGGYAWTGAASQGQSHYLSGYEYHNYPSADSVTSGSLIDSLNSDVSGVDSNDTADKPVYLSEMGITNPDYSPSPAINTYAYGLDMFDYGIQAAIAGESSAMAWCVDGFDQNKNCGMWDISGLNGGTTLRPWFYSWSLLNRYFPSNATIYRMNAPANVRVVAASVPTGTQEHWSFALVNENSTDQSMTLQVPGWGSGTFNEYVYSSGGNPTDGNGFPVPTAQITTASGGLAQGLTVDVPAGSGVVLTTLDGSPLSQITGTWQSWTSLGGVLSASPAASAWDANHENVFVQGTSGALYEDSWNGSSWSGFTSLGGPTDNSFIGAPAAVSRQANIIDVYVRGNDNALWELSYTNGQWGNWTNLGGVLSASPAASAWDANHENVFVQGTSGALYEDSWNGSSWSGFTSLGGPTGNSFTGAPASVSRQANGIDVYVRGTDNALWKLSYSNGQWGSWTSLGGVISASPAASAWDANHENVFVQGTSGALYEDSWNGSSWSGFTDLGGPTGNSFIGAPAAVSRQANVIDVYVRGNDNALWELSYT